MAADYIPTEVVQRLFSQGKSEQEIVAQLRLQGFTPQQITSAINQSIKEVVKGEAPAPAAPPKPLGLAPEERPLHPAREQTAGVPRPRASAGPQPMPVSRRPEPQKQTPIPMPANLQTAEPMRGPIGMPPEKISAPMLRPLEIPPEQTFARQIMRPTAEISVEELVEAVVNERWVKFEEKLSTYDKRDVGLQQQIQDLKKQVEELKNETRQKESTLIEKLDEFGGNLDKSQARIGSIESAFREFVPTLAKNVKSLADVVERLKKAK